MPVEFGQLPVDITLNELPIEVKIRALALVLANQHHKEAVVQDASMYQALLMNGVTITPLTHSLVLETAIAFEKFLLGDYTKGLIHEVVEEQLAEFTASLDGTE